jgi:phosphoserine aminotransferase
MNDEKQQKFTSKVRRGLVWVHKTANAELDRVKAEAGGGRISGMNASELADLEAALTWIAQNKETT